MFIAEKEKTLDTLYTDILMIRRNDVGSMQGILLNYWQLSHIYINYWEMKIDITAVYQPIKKNTLHYEA